MTGGAGTDTLDDPVTAPDPDRGPDHGEVVIRCEGLGKRFGDTWILRDIDLTVAAGSIVGLIGPSGSGKTTVVRLMNGVYRPDEGSVEVKGVSPSDRRCADRTELGYLPQDPVLFEELSLWENLNFHASLNGVPFRRSKRLHGLLDLVDLDEHRKKLVSESSGGMKRRLGLAATLVHDPQILLLDEPTAGIDPILRTRFWDHFREIASSGKSLVITTQFVEEAALCDVVGVLADGRVCAVGTPDELRVRAMGGRVVEVVFDGDVDARRLHSLLDHDRVVEANIVGARRIRCVLDVGAGDLDEVTAELTGDLTAQGYEVTGIQEETVDWNAIFVRLVEAASSEVDAAEPIHDESHEDGPADEELDDAPVDGSLDDAPVDGESDDADAVARDTTVDDSVVERSLGDDPDETPPSREPGPAGRRDADDPDRPPWTPPSGEIRPVDGTDS